MSVVQAAASKNVQQMGAGGVMLMAHCSACESSTGCFREGINNFDFVQHFGKAIGVLCENSGKPAPNPRA
jgi:hypothetical protein